MKLPVKVLSVIIVVVLVVVCTALWPADRSAQANQITATCANHISDAGTINAAIDRSKTGDEVVIKGQCLINSTIKLRGDRSYRGESRTGTVLKQANNANLTALLATDGFMDNTSHTGAPVSVRQLTLNGNKAGNTAATNGLVLRSWQSNVEDAHITGFHGSGLKVTNKSLNGTPITNTMVNGRIANNFIEASGSHGIFVEDTGNSVSDWNLLDNWVADSGADAIHIDNAAGWIVERNHMYGVSNNGIYAHRLFGSSISDNYIEGFGESAVAGTYYGIQATAQGDAAAHITNNRIFSLGSHNAASTYRYLGVARVNYGSGVVTVNNNIVRGFGTPNTTGLYYNKDSGTGLTVTSTGNNISSVNQQRDTGEGVLLNIGL